MSRFKLVIGNKNYSSWSLRAWLMMKHADIPFEEIIIPLQQAETKKLIEQHSPTGRVPVIFHDDWLVWDSLSIGEYLAEIFPDKHFWPADLQARSWARSIVSEMHSGFVPMRKACRMDLKRINKPTNAPAEALHDIARIQNIWEETYERYGQNGSYLMGEYSLVDMFFAPVVTRFVSYGIPTSELCRNYINTMVNHPHMQEWTEAALKENWVMTW